MLQQRIFHSFKQVCSSAGRGAPKSLTAGLLFPRVLRRSKASKRTRFIPSYLFDNVGSSWTRTQRPGLLRGLFLTNVEQFLSPDFSSGRLISCVLNGSRAVIHERLNGFDQIFFQLGACVKCIAYSNSFFFFYVKKSMQKPEATETRCGASEMIIPKCDCKCRLQMWKHFLLSSFRFFKKLVQCTFASVF